MADLQRQFRKFDEEISLERDKERATLAEKRERILDRLADGIKAQRTKGRKIPSYGPRNQGSYAMGTGIKPLDGDYDLDVALVFELSKNDYDPVEVKRWVFDALDEHTKEVRVREPCVTVFYQRQGEPVYHVDLAVYAGESFDGQTYLARGKLGSSGEHKKWEVSDPEGLIKAFQERFPSPDERQQFKRVIKYLKRWKGVQFSAEGYAAPTGIALTACAYRWFVPVAQFDAIANTRTELDLKALLGLVREMLSRFSGSRLSVTLPVPPGNDLFERMSDDQMDNMKWKLQKLRDHLQMAWDEPDPHEAAKHLAVLGDDFPVPDKKETGVKKAAAIVTSGHSA